jgi:hypothetical protein
MIDALQKLEVVKGKENHPKDLALDWVKLYKNGHGAIEFSPYLGHISGTRIKSGVVGGWYDSIDMASGAIVNKTCIRKIVKLYDGTEDFNDMGIKL